MSRTRRDRGKRALILVQNLPVPFDRRVWLECQALVSAGWRVSVICPKGEGDPKRHTVGDVELYKYRPYPPTVRKAGFLAEYAYSFVMTLWLSCKVWVRTGFDVVQTCNPPDIFWPIGLLARALTGARYVFDQHDLCPELYQSRFPDGARLPYRGLRFLEYMNYRTATEVIATNASYREIAIRRGGKSPEHVTVVRSAPDTERLRRQPCEPELRRGHRFLVAYIGVMGPQDGVDIVLHAVHEIVHTLGRDDIAFTLMGKGDCYEELSTQLTTLDLGDHVQLPGRVPDEVAFEVLSSADVGLSPDPRNPLNDLSTMNKTMEYMSFELPVVAFDLKETRVSAGDAAVYVEPNDVRRYAHAIVDLLDDAPRRGTMGAIGRRRVEHELAWRHQRLAYLAVYDRVMSPARRIRGEQLAEANR